MQEKPKKFRFAPSPNGLLHLGHAYSALTTAELAQNLGGDFQLRIEDIDQARSKDEFIAAIYRDLHWLGLTWPNPVRRQSEHLQDYRAAIERLNDLELLYPCFATRSEIKAHWQNAGSLVKKDPDGALLYPGLYKNQPPEDSQARINKGTPYALRLHMDRAIKRAENLIKQQPTYKAFDEYGHISDHVVSPAAWGDVIIARKDIPTSYHLSVVVDDEVQNITHICRGKDLERATDVHRILQINLGFSAPCYHHHDLVQLSGEKLSKSKQHPALQALRDQGVSAHDIKTAMKQGPEILGSLLKVISP